MAFFSVLLLVFFFAGSAVDAISSIAFLFRPLFAFGLPAASVCVSLAFAPFLVGFLAAGSSSGAGCSSATSSLTREPRVPLAVGAATVSIVTADSSAGVCSGRGSFRASCSVVGRSMAGFLTAGFSTAGSSAGGLPVMDRPVAERRLTRANLASATASCVVHRSIFAGF